MHAEVIRRHLDAQPFLPLRIHVSDGSTYEVHDRGHVFVWTRQLIIGTEIGRNELPLRSVYIDPVHVTRIEPIVNGEPPHRNGA